MLYLIWAPPSEGKSYFATAKAIELMLLGKTVYSNYPIVYKQPLTIAQRIDKSIVRIHNKLVKDKWKVRPNNIYSSYKWEDDYVYSGISKSHIFIDEAYNKYSSREKNVVKDVHSFFATNGHDGNDIYLIAQHYNRIDLVLREMANYYVLTHKTSNPLSRVGEGARDDELKPLFFNVEYYLSEEDFKFRRVKNTAWKKRRLWFNKDIGLAYDTKYFRKNQNVQNPKKWVDLMNVKVIDNREETFKEEFIHG